MIEASEYTTGIITQLTCLRCNHKWFPVRPSLPAHCPKCKSPYWNKPKGNNTNRLDPEKAQEYPAHCFRCNHNWKTLLKRPTQCPKCHSSYWDKPKNDQTVVATIAQN